MLEVTLDDGSSIEVLVAGNGPVLLLPVAWRPVLGARAEELRAWGADPRLGKRLVDGLGRDLTVAAFDYEAHLMAHPRPNALTPQAVAQDVLAVADAVGAQRFAYYGYSWLAVVGLQVAVRTDRLWALAMGGFPPLDGPYAQMLAVTSAAVVLAEEAAVAEEPAAAPEPGDWSSTAVTTSVAQSRQFLALYEALRDFDDRAAQARVTCPRLCVVGSSDVMDYGEAWGGVRVDLAGPVTRGRQELQDLGWAVHVLDGLDHLGAMQADVVLPLLAPWLREVAPPPMP